MAPEHTFARFHNRLRKTGLLALAGIFLLGVAALPTSARAQDKRSPAVQFFRIGTGPTTGVYFPVGAMIASVISNPPGSRPCDRGGSCGVPNLIAVAQATQDSVERLGDIADRDIESALVQSDVAYLAYAGKGPFARGRVGNLRAIAKLYPEYLHVVVRGDLPIRSFADLRSRRIGLDTDGSGTRIMAQAVLPQVGLKLGDMTTRAITVSGAADQMRARRIDAFAFTSGIPAELILRLAEDMPLRLLPISPAIAQRVSKSGRPGLYAGTIPANVYGDNAATPTVATDALWVVSAETDADLVYQLARALWHPNNRRLLDAGHPVGRAMQPGAALNGLTIPLHPGAERYYREMGFEIPPKAAAPKAPPMPAPRPARKP
jgi:TRAP transporter TAXI family solute receptor